MMKKYLVTYILVFISFGMFAQTTFQATIQPVPGGAAAVTVLVKTSATKTGKVSGLTLTIAIPVSASPTRPPISVSFPNPNIFLTVPIYNAVPQSVNGVSYYIYNILAEGNVTQAIPTVTYDANVDVPMATINFGGDPALSSQIRLVNLPDGGTDPNPNSFFGFSIDGADVVNEPAMFYAIPPVSTAVNDGNGYSGTSYAQTTGAVPLPVRFMNFNASRKEKNALLIWQIANESAATDYYEIERSLNGTDFKKIGRVIAKNNGNTTNSYDLTDLNLPAIRSAGIFYYRVKQVDKDGRFIYSEIRNLRFNSKGIAIAVYPNPTRNSANVTIDLEQDADATITITDPSGKQVQNNQMQLFKGLNIKKINMSALAAGSYILKVQTATETKTMPVVKTN